MKELMCRVSFAITLTMVKRAASLTRTIRSHGKAAREAATRDVRSGSSCRFGSAELRGSCCRGGHRSKNASHSLDCRFGIGAQSVPPRDPSRIVVGEPGSAFSVLPNQHLQRQIDANRLRRLHKWRSSLGIAEY